MLKTKFQRMNKEEKKKAISRYYKTDLGKENAMRFKRLLIVGLLCLAWGIYLFIDAIIKGGNYWSYSLATCMVIFGLIFLIGRVKIRSKQVNDFLTKKRK